MFRYRSMRYPACAMTRLWTYTINNINSYTLLKSPETAVLPQYFPLQARQIEKEKNHYCVMSQTLQERVRHDDNSSMCLMSLYLVDALLPVPSYITCLWIHINDCNLPAIIAR